MIPTIAVIAAHLIFLLCVRPAPISSDALYYHNAAGRIADGYGYSGDQPHVSFMPGYPVFLAGLYFVFGKHPWLVRVVQVLLLGISATLLALTVERFADRKVARLAFFLMSLFPAWFIYPGTLIAETLLLALEVLFLWSIARPLQVLGWSQLLGWAAAGGAIAGLLALVKPEFCLWLPAVALVAIGQSLPWKKVAQVGAMSAIACALIMTPWVIRNAYAFHRFIPLSVKVGATLWISGHQPEITEFQDPQFLTEFAKCEVVGDPKATDDCMGKDARAMIARHPGYFLRTSVRRFVHTLLGSHTETLSDFSISFSEAIQSRQTRVLAVKGTLLIVNTLFVVSGIVGLVWIGWRRQFWFLPYLVLVKLAIHAVLFGTPRYGLHLSPIFASTAAVVGMAGFRWWRRRRVLSPVAS